jgi:fibronectin type 3 domain-containing protein
LCLTSNASNSSAAIALSGTGVSGSSAHSVTLDWSASASGTAIGYYVYRGTQSGGPYTQITATAVTGTTYTDSSVSSGTTYYYVLTAVGSTGQQSAYSNQTVTSIPTP